MPSISAMVGMLSIVYVPPCPGPGVGSIDLTAGGPAAELHTPSAGSRRGWHQRVSARTAGPRRGLVAEQLQRMASTPSEDCGSAPMANGQAAEIHAPLDITGHHRTGFRGGRLAEQLALPAGLGGLALTAAGLAAGPTSTPSEDGGPAPKAKGIAAEIHELSAGFRRGRLPVQPL
ncbi:hypothetical protein NQZ68_040184 [Dissostichus eleginoides]|nr:hypothetical protein NQZ68_040184 [Dissostichus eleginoides]